MWTLEQLVFITITAGYATLTVIRRLTPWLESLLRFPQGVLVSVKMVPEIETHVYIASIILFSFCFLLISVLLYFIRKRYSRFGQFISLINSIALIYLLITPELNIFRIDLIRPQALFLSAAVSVFFYIYKKRPVYGVELLAGLVSVRWLLKPMAKYDVGAREFPTLMSYLFYAVSWLQYVFIAGLGFFLYKKSHFFQTIFQGITMKKIHVLLFLSISMSLIFLMMEARAPVDIFFTLIPAYHIVSGGTPLVNVMSQYGLLYLAPWVIWLVLFPALPVTFRIGSVVTCLLLIGYFSFLFYLGRKLFARRLVFISTMVALYYFSILIRYYGFPDPYSLVSAPAFTPLRFGMFIFPLWYLVHAINEKSERLYMAFLISSALFFYYSFEAGIGMIAAGIFISIVHAFESRTGWLGRLLRNWITIGISLAGIAGIFSIGILLRSGHLPDFRNYWAFAVTFGSGFLALPIGGQSGMFLTLAIPIFGMIFGLYQVFIKRCDHGYIVLYLSVISLTQMPYYMGRSVYPTLYNLSVSFILLCGVLTEQSLILLQEKRHRTGYMFVAGISGFALFVGVMRGGIILGNTIIHAPETAYNAFTYVRATGVWWGIKNDPKYEFLRTYLPASCPLVSFDADEYSLLPALSAYPAFQYAFLRGFVVTQKQVDSLRPQRNAKYICLFVNRTFIESHDDLMGGLIVYFWKRYGNNAQLIVSDEEKGYSLYRIPAYSFIAK